MGLRVSHSGHPECIFRREGSEVADLRISEKALSKKLLFSVFRLAFCEEQE